MPHIHDVNRIAMRWGHKARRGAIALTCLWALSPLCFAVNWVEASPATPKRTDNAATISRALPSLVYCSESAPDGFDPAQRDSGVDFVAGTLPLYNRLVELERGGLKVEPGLAERWEVSADGLVYTFHLRHGVQFHTTPYFSPSREMNADDVLWTFNRLFDPAHAFNRAYPVYFSLLARMRMDTLIANLKKLDDYTVQFTLNAPNAPFVKHMTMPFGSIMSAEYAEKLLAQGRPADINTKPIGTGPFVFRSYVDGAVIRFDRNPTYWKKDAVNLSKVIFDITPNANVRAHKLKRNECQVMVYPRLTDLKVLRGYRDIEVLSHPGLNTSFLSYNVLRPTFQHKAVRQALDMAIDRAAIIHGVYHGAARVARTAVPPLKANGVDSLPASVYDPEKAKQLLHGAGFENGLDITLTAISIDRPYNPDPRLMAELIQADWAKIGVRAKIKMAEPGVFYSTVRAGEHDVAVMGWGGDTDDPDTWLTPMLSCQGDTGEGGHRWCDARLDDLLRRGRETSVPKARAALYRQAEAMAAENVAISPIAHATVFQPIRHDVEGFRLGPFNDVRFDGVTRW